MHHTRMNQEHSVWVAAVTGAITVGFAVLPARGQLSGDVKVDGSSTVAPIMMAAAELFQVEHHDVRVTVGISGTGGGFKKFLDEDSKLRTDISDASRPITTTELGRAHDLGVEFIEIPIGIDGIAVMVHPSNTFCDRLTVDELKQIWRPGSGITNWSQVRDGFPDLPLMLYGPGVDSGTFDYFTEAIVGEAKASRSDYTASESDNVLVRGIAGDRGALGYFGFSYYEANLNKLHLVAVDDNSGRPVKPSQETIRAGTYKPLSRPLFLYVNKKAYQRPEVSAFLGFIFQNAKTIVEHPRVNYVSLDDELYRLVQDRLRSGKTGSAMAAVGGHTNDLAGTYRTH